MKASRLWLDIARMEPAGEALEGALEETVLEIAADDPLIRSAGAVHYSLRAEIVANELIVRGAVRTRIGFACSRCALWFEREVGAPDFFFSRDVSEAPEGVDLTESLREAIMLALPAYPLCRAECKGLCPRCGCDLNAGSCTCAPPADIRWRVLDDL